MLSTADLLIFTTTLLLALTATAVNARAAHRGIPMLRPTRAFMAVLAAIYAAGFLVVLFGNVNPAAWSAFFRPIGLIAWPAAWIIPTIQADRVWGGVEAAVNQLREEAGE